MEDEKVEIYDGGEDDSEQIESHEVKEKPKKEKIIKEDKNAMKRKQMLEAVEEGNKVAEESKKMLRSGAMIMEGAFSKIHTYIEAIAKGYSTGLLILGESGLGKSYTTRKALNKLNIYYEVVEAYITPPELFLALFRCRKKGNILLLDDCHKLLEDPRCLSYLKCALASTQELNKGRTVTNATQKPLQDPISGMYVPNTFPFEGNVIILTNVLNEKNSHIKAVISRLDHVKLVFSEEQKFKIMEEIVKISYSTTNEDARRYCLEYLKTNSTICPKYVINLRTLKKLFDYYLFCKETNNGVFNASTFDLMGRGLLDLDNDGVDDSDIICARELEKKGDLSREDKCNEFMSLQDKSRATYFRVLERAGIIG